MYFYPQGVSLALQTIDFVDSFIAAPLTIFVGEVAAFNITVLLSFVLAAFTMFLLARHLTSSWWAAFGSGLVFAYAPQHVTQALAGHPNLTSIEWLPAFLLALILTFERKKMKYAVISGLTLAVLTYTELELMILALMIAIIYVCYQLIIKRLVDLKRVFFLLSIAIIIWIAISSPYIITAYQALGVVHAAPSLKNAIKNAAKPELYLIPPPSSISYGNIFLSFYEHANLSGGPSQWVLFVGYVSLTLAIVGAILSTDRRRFVFVIGAILAFLFSLGPSSNPRTISVQTPYTFLYNHISILHYFRAEARFSILLMLCLAILVAYGIDEMIKLFDGHVNKLGISRGKLLGLILVVLIIIEFAPTIVVAVVPSDPIFSKIAHESGQFAILELPATRGTSQIYLYEQTIFDKPLINGKISQSGVNVPEYMRYQIFICELLLRACPAQNVIVQPYTDKQMAPIILSYYNIKYIIVNKALLSKSNLNKLTNLLSNSLGSPLYQDQQVVLYGLKSFVSNASVTQMATSSPLAFFGSGWSTVRLGVTTNGSANLVVYVAQEGNYMLYMKSTAFPTCVQNKLLLNQFQCGNFDPSTGISAYDVFLAQGRNILNVQANTPTNVTFISFNQSSP